MAKFNLEPAKKKKTVVKGNNSHQAAVKVNSVDEFHWMIGLYSTFYRRFTCYLKPNKSFFLDFKTFF